MPNVSNNLNLLQENNNTAQEGEFIGFGNRIGQQNLIDKLTSRQRSY